MSSGAPPPEGVPTTVERADGMFRFACPYCALQIEVAVGEVNCAEFVHAADRATGQQANPHADATERARLRTLGDATVGCAGAFRLDVAGMRALPTGF